MLENLMPMAIRGITGLQDPTAQQLQDLPWKQAAPLGALAALSAFAKSKYGQQGQQQNQGQEAPRMEGVPIPMGPTGYAQQQQQPQFNSIEELLRSLMMQRNALGGERPGGLLNY